MTEPSVTRNPDGSLYVDLTKLDYVDGEAVIDAEELREEIMMKSMISYDVGNTNRRRTGEQNPRGHN